MPKTNSKYETLLDKGATLKTKWVNFFFCKQEHLSCLMMSVDLICGHSQNLPCCLSKLAKGSMCIDCSQLYHSNLFKLNYLLLMINLLNKCQWIFIDTFHYQFLHFRGHSIELVKLILLIIDANERTNQFVIWHEWFKIKVMWATLVLGSDRV